MAKDRVVSYGLDFCVYIIVHYKVKPSVAYLSVYLDTRLEFCVVLWQLSIYICIFYSNSELVSCTDAD